MQKNTMVQGISPRLLILSPALVFLVAAASSHAGSRSVREADHSRISVTDVAGDVDVTMAGNHVSVAPDSTVLLPARVVTGHDGTLGVTQAGTNITVSTDTDVEIPAEAVDGNLVARLVQHSGNVFYDVAPRDLGKLRVETPFLVAVIKGTQFNVAVHEGGTTISLFEGTLEIRTPDDSDVIQLNAGEIAIRSLIDDSIRVIGMNDARVALPPVVPQAADDEPTPPAADAVAVADDVVAARADASAPVALESATTTVVSVGVIDVALDAGVGTRGNAADLALDPGVELAVTQPADVVNAPDLRLDAGLDLGALDAGPGIDLATIDPGANLTLDQGVIDLTLGATGGALDLNLNVGGNANVQLDLGPAVPAPTRLPHGPPPGVLPVSSPLL